MTSGARSCGAPVAPGTCPSAIHAPAMDHLILGPRGLQHGLERAEQPLRLVAVVGREIADVDVDGDEATLRPRMNGEMRFGEQHGACDALRLELVERVADDREPGIAGGLQAYGAQRFATRELRRVGRASVPFA